MDLECLARVVSDKHHDVIGRLAKSRIDSRLLNALGDC